MVDAKGFREIKATILRSFPTDFRASKLFQMFPSAVDLSCLQKAVCVAQTNSCNDTPFPLCSENFSF